MMSQPADKSSEKQAVVCAEHLDAYWGDQQSLIDVSLDVYSGEIVVIMGPSGCGKSTLLRYLLGLQRPAAGTVRLFGKDLHKLNLKQRHQLRKRIGMSFQGGAIFNSMTLSENIALPLREHTELDEDTIQVLVRMKLQLVNMAGFEQLMPAQLSGGMLKRAALARAIVLDPPLLFFDEPSSGLDPVIASEMDDLILNLRDVLGTTIVVVSHRLDSTFKIADRVMVLDHGASIFFGNIAELKRSDNPRVQDLLHHRSSVEEINPELYLERLTSTLKEKARKK